MSLYCLCPECPLVGIPLSLIPMPCRAFCCLQYDHATEKSAGLGTRQLNSVNTVRTEHLFPSSSSSSRECVCYHQCLLVRDTYSVIVYLLFRG